jgi:hypothetical protein
VDSNPSFVNVFKVFNLFASWLMSGHACSCMENLKAYSLSHNKVVIDIGLPNATRVAGVVLVMQFLMQRTSGQWMSMLHDDYMVVMRSSTKGIHLRSNGTPV